MKNKIVVIFIAREILKTNIDGLVIRMNKVVAGATGALCELAPAGFSDEFFSTGVKNIYASIATAKGSARGGHYHMRQNENFYVLSGTLLWIFVDFRENSKTNGEIFSVITGFAFPKENKNIPAYTIDKNQMAQLFIPAGVYHIWGQLSEEKAVVLAVSSEHYDKTDYAYPKIEELPKVKKILDEFNMRF